MGPRRTLFIEHVTEQTDEQAKRKAEAEATQHAHQQLKHHTQHLADALLRSPTLRVVQTTRQHLQKSGVPPDAQFYAVALRTLLSQGARQEALTLLKEMEAQATTGGVSPSLSHYHILLYFLAREGRHQDVERWLRFELGPRGFSPDVMTYATLAAGYACHGSERHVLAMVRRVRKLKAWEGEREVACRRMIIEALLKMEQFDMARQEMEVMEKVGVRDDAVYNLYFTALATSRTAPVERNLALCWKEYERVEADPHLFLTGATRCAMIEACLQDQDLKKLLRMQELALGKDTASDRLLRRALMVSYIVADSLKKTIASTLDALEEKGLLESDLFDRIIQGIIIRACRHRANRLSQVERALFFLEECRRRGKKPARKTYVALVDALSSGVLQKQLQQTHVRRILQTCLHAMEQDGYPPYLPSPELLADLIIGETDKTKTR